MKFSDLSSPRLVLLMLLSCLAGMTEAAVVASVQQGVTTSSGNGAVVVTLGRTVDPARAVLFFSSRHNSNRPPGSMIRGRLAGTSTVVFDRVTNESSAIDINWTVVEFESGVRVQRGTFNTTSSAQNVSLAQPVASTQQAFVLWSKTPAATDVIYSEDDPIGGYLLNAGTVRFEVDTVNTSHVIDYQVVEYTTPGEIFVQSGVSPFGRDIMQLDVNLPVAVDTGASLLLGGFTTSDDGSDIDRRMLDGQLLDPSTLRFSRTARGDEINDVYWQVVEFRDGTSVQHGVENFAAGQAIRTAALATPVVPASSVALSAMQPVGGLNMGSSTYRADDILGTGSFTFALSASALDIQRSNVAASSSVGWFVVSFVDVSAALDLHMDELQWTGAVGEVLDSASGFSGTAFGGATTDGAQPAVAGNPGTCRYGDFDGVDDHVIVPHDPSLNGTDALVYAAWVRPRDWSGVRQVMAKSVHGGGSGRTQMGIFSESGVLKLRAETRAGRFEATAALPPLDTWSHVAGVFSGDELLLYVNGALVGSDSFAPTILWQTTDDLAIGKRIGTSQYFFDGFIDEVQVFTQVLDGSAIAQLMARTRPCAAGPVGEWHFDEFGWNGTDGEVVDYSGNGYDGTAFNTVTDTGQVCNAAGFAAPGTSDFLVLDHTPWDGLADFTIATWYRGTQNGQMTWISGARAGEDDELTFTFSGTNRFRPYLLGSRGSTINAPGLTDGSWHFVAWTRQGPSNCLYVDDVLQGCTNLPTGALRIDPGGLIVAQEQTLVGGGFRDSRALEGDLDELILFAEALSQAELAQIRANNLAGFDWDGAFRTCPVTGASGFVLSHDNAGIHCLDEPVAVSAIDAFDALVPSYVNEVTLQTSTGRGSWSLGSGAGILDDATLDDGRATYLFVPADNGSATFVLSYPEGDALVDVDVFQSDDVTVRDTDAEGLLLFSPSGFTVTQSLLPNPPPSPINDPLTTQTAGSPFPLHLTAYGVTDDDPQCGIIESYAGSRDLKFTMAYDNPGSGTRRASVDGAFAATSAPAAVAQPVLFSNGQASVTVNYKDVGAIRLSLVDDGSFTQVLSGASNSFVVQPARLAVTRIESAAGVPNPGAASLAGARFVAAGEAFEVDVAALDADGDVTPNFGLETPAEFVSVTSPALVLPLGGRNGASGDVLNGASFSLSGSAGVFSNNSVSFDETGVITLTPNIRDGDYLGTGGVPGGSSGNVGRFYPARFELLGDAVTPSCATFTYMGEPALGVAYLLQAQTTSGAVTQNYDEIDLGVPVASVVHVAENADAGVNLGGRLSTIDARWDDGEALVSRSDVRFARALAPDGPFDALRLGVVVTDPADPVPLSGLDMNAATAGDCIVAGNCNARSLGTPASLVYGRLVVLPSFGPENLDLAVGLEAQLFSGAAFQQHVLDNCSIYSVGRAALATYTGNLTAADTALLAPVPDTSLLAGAEDDAAPLTLAAPGIGQDGSVDVSLDVPAWLEFDWLGGGAVDPQGTATFGRYRGHDRIIFWREVR